MIVYADSQRTGTCRSCGAAVEWVTSVRSEHAAPFDPPIVFESDLLLELDPQVRRVDLGRSVSHFATCPQAEAWRRRRGQQHPEGKATW